MTRTAEFQATKAFLVKKKKRGTIVEESQLLFADLKAGRGQNKAVRDAITTAVFETCLSQLAAQGLIRRLPFGDWVLLQPELLDDYCGWMTQAARAEPDGLGFLWEDDATAGRFPMDNDRPLAARKKDEQLLLLASVEESLINGLAIRETAAENVDPYWSSPPNCVKICPTSPASLHWPCDSVFRGQCEASTHRSS